MTHSIFNGAGYFMNDDRASGGSLDEDDIIACAHCAKALKKHLWKQHGGMCCVCAKPLCTVCTQRTFNVGCEGPQEKQIERAVNEFYRRQQNAKILGIG
jgi:hypothetical protein